MNCVWTVFETEHEPYLSSWHYRKHSFWCVVTSHLTLLPKASSVWLKITAVVWKSFTNYLPYTLLYFDNLKALSLCTATLLCKYISLICTCQWPIRVVVRITCRGKVWVCPPSTSIKSGQPIIIFADVLTVVVWGEDWRESAFKIWWGSILKLIVSRTSLEKH